MKKDGNNKQYDLEERTLVFARDIRKFVAKLPKTVLYLDDIRQLLRASGSVGANYIEANEALSKKDFLMRIKISRKESKETCYWLKVIMVNDPAITEEQSKLLQEATELMMIFSAILRKSV